MRRSALALLLGCLLLVAGASALDGYYYYQTIEYAACDQDIYQQDIVIHRSTGTAYNETAGGLETWHIYVGEHCREDYGDVRFTNSTGELAYYLWPDYSSSSARFAVRLTGATSAGAVTAWYGNAGATTTSDGDATYEHWAYFGQTPPTGDYLSTDSWGTGHAVQSKVRIPSLGNGYYLCAWRDPGFTKWVTFRSWDSASFRGEIYSPHAYSTALRSQDTNWHVVEIRRIGTTASFIWDGEPVYSATHAVVDDALSVGTYGADSGKTSQLEWILVRTCSAAPPAATTFSGEHETPAPPATAFRPKATAPIPTLDESPYLALIEAFGGSNQLNETTEGVDWLGIIDAAERPYTDLIGPFFYVIVFAIPFVMQWLRQGSMAVPAAIGIILGGIMLAKTPAEYHLAAIAFIALSILAVVWGVIKDRN